MFTTLQDSVVLIIVLIILILMIVAIVIGFGTYRKIMIEVEEDEFEAAKREAMRRSVGVSVESEREIAKTIVYMSRNRIGGSIIIEGRNQLIDIEDTGDSFGFGRISSEFLNTLMSSPDMGHGALLIRRDHIVAYNCRMPIYRDEQLINQGAGNRHLGAAGTMLQNKDAVILVVSGATGKISIFGHLGKETSVDLGLQLKDTDIINGVGEEELVYRIHTLLENVGMLGDLNGDDIQREIEMKYETKEEKKARIAREREEKQKERNREAKQKELERQKQQVQREKEQFERQRGKDKERVVRRRKQENERKQKEKQKEKERRRKLLGR